MDWGQVYSIKGNIYFIGDSSIFSFDGKTNRFVPDTTFGRFTDGGGNNEFDMVEDNRARVWIRFGKELGIAIPKPGGGYTYSNTLLNSISELTIQKIFAEKDGIVWLGTTDGLIRYDENVEDNKDQSFKAIIRQVAVGRQLLINNATSPKKPVPVSFTNATMRFEYAAPYFQQEEKTAYQTWLEGFENDWSELGNNYYKEYTNLPVGKYTFHVRAINIYKTQSEEAVYSFKILPPWYRTWWAYLFYALVSIAVIILIIRWRTNQLHEKHRELEKTVAQRTTELSQRVEELAVINSVQSGLVSELDMQAIDNLVGK